jgi:hypothetical protein
MVYAIPDPKDSTMLGISETYMVKPSIFMANFIIGLLDKNGYNGGDLW